MIKILAVDDESDVLRLISTKLAKAGFEVSTAQDGKQAVERALEVKPDLIIMDVMMPEMDGFTATRLIKEQLDPSPLVLMLTAKGTEDDVVEGLGTGADDYMIKPFAPRELIARVKLALLKSGKRVDGE